MLRSFVLQRMRSFSLDRAKTDRDSTSRLSPHVHFGEVSVRQVYYVVRPLYILSAGTCLLQRLALLASWGTVVLCVRLQGLACIDFL